MNAPFCPQCMCIGRLAKIHIGPFQFAAVDCPACDCVSYLPSPWSWFGFQLNRLGFWGSVHVRTDR